MQSEHSLGQFFTSTKVKYSLPGFVYSGLNFADIMQRQGQYPSPRKPPFVPGLEFAGTVEELGEDVTDLEVSLVEM